MFFFSIAETDTTEPVAATEAITSPVWVRVVTHNMQDGIVVLGTLCVCDRDTEGKLKQKTAKYFSRHCVFTACNKLFQIEYTRHFYFFFRNDFQPSWI